MSESPLKFSLNAPNWDIVNLKDASVFIKDGTHGTHERVLEGIPLLSAKNISPLGTITIDDDDSLISEVEYNKIHSKYELKKNDLLITVVGTLGRSALVASNKRFSIQRSIGVIRCLEANVRPEFLYQFTGTDYFQSQLVLRSNATAQAGIYLGELAKIEVPRPPLPEQKKIAAILSSVDEVIEKTRAQIDKLKDLKTGMMQELLTKGIGPGGVPHTEFKDSPVGGIPAAWRTDLLGNLAEFVNGNSFKADDWSETGYPIIRIQNLNGDGNFNYYNKDVNPRWVIENGDLLFAWSGQRGKSFGARIWRGATGVLNQHIFKVNVNDSFISKDYLHLLMQQVQVDIERHAHGFKDSFMHVKKSDLVSQEVALPPLKEQLAIVRAIGSLQGKLASASKKLDAVLKIKKALMQDLLTGKVRVQVDTRELAKA